MTSKQGRFSRRTARLFRERQIYHRADGVVRFVKLSARTQMVMAGIIGAALLWVAYASVNVVFKEQIIVSKDTERRNQEAAYRRRLQTAESAYDEVRTLNFIYQREFDAAVSSLRSQHDALRGLVEDKATLDSRLDALAERLSVGGAPGGRELENAGRLMIDPAGREPTPRQPRIDALREEARRSLMDRRPMDGAGDEVLGRVSAETADLSARQAVLLASLEDDLRQRARELSGLLEHTGVATAQVVDHAATSAEPGPHSEFAGMGGPFIPAEEDATSAAYYRAAARVSGSLDRLDALERAVASLPIGTPVAARHRVSSGFGTRWDPIRRNRRAQHRGLDFAARHNTPLLATAPGRVSFAGTRGGFGRTVEVDHGNGFKTRFAHMNRIEVSRGQAVEVGDTVGLMGSTGRSTGTHLHYEVLYMGRQVDPKKFIEAGRYVYEG